MRAANITRLQYYNNRFNMWIVINFCLLLMLAASGRGELTQNSIPMIVAGQPYHKEVPESEFFYARYKHESSEPFFVYVDACTGNPDLYIKSGEDLPTLVSYHYLSTNSRSDFLQISQGPGIYTIGVYGSTATNFSVEVTLHQRVKISALDPNIRLVHISPNTVRVMWYPVELLAYDQSDEWQYMVYIAPEMKVRHSILDTPCGMQRFGIPSKEVLRRVRSTSNFLYLTTVNLPHSHGHYAINVLAFKKDTKYAYKTLHFQAVDFTDLKLDRPLTGHVAKDSYAYYRFSTAMLKIEDDEVKDNYYIAPEYTITLSLSSVTGDADLFVSENVGPPTFDSCSYSSEGLFEDSISLRVYDNSTALYIGVYGKEESMFKITARFSTKAIHGKESAQTNDPKSTFFHTIINALLFIAEILLELA